MRIAVVGKGGAGKSVVAGTIARLLARRGERVLALDSDLMPGLALSLGTPQAPDPPLLHAAERRDDGRWRLKKGIGPVRAVQRFAREAPDGVRLLECGKLTAEGLAPIMPAVQAYYAVIHRLARERALPGWSIVGDLPAGPRQTAFDWAPYAETFVVVVEPTWKSVLTARRIARIARSRGGASTVAVANKITSTAELDELRRRLGGHPIASIPLDPAVAEAERDGVAPIDRDQTSPAVKAIEELVARVR